MSPKLPTGWPFSVAPLAGAQSSSTMRLCRRAMSTIVRTSPAAPLMWT